MLADYKNIVLVLIADPNLEALRLVPVMTYLVFNE